MGITSGAQPLTHWEHRSSPPFIVWGAVAAQSLVFRVVLSGSLFVFLIFFSSLYYLCFIDLRLLIATSVSSDFSCAQCSGTFLRYKKLSFVGQNKYHFDDSIIIPKWFLQYQLLNNSPQVDMINTWPYYPESDLPTICPCSL